MRLPILLLLLSAVTLSWGGDSMIDRRLREAVQAMAENPVPNTPSPVDRGVRLLLAEGAMEGEADAVVKAFSDTFALVGRPQLSEEVAVRAYGSRCEIAYFVLPCVRGPAFVRVVSLKRGDNQRVVGGIMVSTRPELVFPPDLLAPEQILRR
jgi:hypothetical protein